MLVQNKLLILGYFLSSLTFIWVIAWLDDRKVFFATSPSSVIIVFVLCFSVFVI